MVTEPTTKHSRVFLHVCFFYSFLLILLWCSWFIKMNILMKFIWIRDLGGLEGGFYLGQFLQDIQHFHFKRVCSQRNKQFSSATFHFLSSLLRVKDSFLWGLFANLVTGSLLWLSWAYSRAEKPIAGRVKFFCWRYLTTSRKDRILTLGFNLKMSCERGSCVRRKTITLIREGREKYHIQIYVILLEI